MTYVIADACIDVRDRSCTEECPVDCIYEGDRKLYIQPAECIDCGACEAVCPQTAAFHVSRVPEEQLWHVEDNRAFFEEALPGRTAPLLSPGGASDIGPVQADTERVRRIPPRD